MMVQDLVGETLILYLVNGVTFTGKILNTTLLKYPDSNGSITSQPVLTVQKGDHKVLIKLNVIMAYEII
ncbi:MAG: hypothetical protein IKD77_04100 [Bacilli bacterium]|nr:hypothetical protein [Bacilli bacterium]